MKASGIGLTALVFSFFSAVPAWSYPGEDRVLSRQALEKYEAGDYKEAEELYRRAAEAADRNAAIVHYNLGAATYKAGKVEEAEQIFRSVYDQENRQLNAAARYNLGVIDQKRAEPAVDRARKAPSLREVPPEQLEPLKKEIEEGIKQLEKAQRNYREAILRAPRDRDIKFNYEVASRDLDFLRRKLEELEPPPQQQDQQQQNQQNQDQQQQKPNQQGQDQNQNQKQNQQNQQQNQDQQPQQQNDQQQRPGQQSDQPQQNRNNDQQKEEGEEGEPKDDEPQQEEQKDEPRKGEQKGQPQQPQGEASGSTGQEPEEPTPGEMSERDVERLLNALPSENTDALQRLLNVRPTRQTDMERDW